MGALCYFLSNPPFGSSHDPTTEAGFQAAIQPLCSDASLAMGMALQLDCRFQKAFAVATGMAAEFEARGLLDSDMTRWIDRAFVTFFKGSATGLRHSMMVSNLIRSVHLFSKDPTIPIIVYCFEEDFVSMDWEPELYPRLIVVHSRSIGVMNGCDRVRKQCCRYPSDYGMTPGQDWGHAPLESQKWWSDNHCNTVVGGAALPNCPYHCTPARGHVSFNFNKLRSMFLRVKTGIQMDADMVVAPNIDLLFPATEREITAAYPFPVFPVHWMTRYKNPDDPNGYDTYAITYPGDDLSGDADKWPNRSRWVHAHPTWTHLALPWVVDTLLMRIDFEKWQTLPRVKAALGEHLQANPHAYMYEDEDLMNIMLWRYKKNKQWCKWDLEPGIYNEYRFFDCLPCLW